MSWLDAFLSAYGVVQSENVALPQRQTLDFTGVGVVITDNALTRVTEVAVPGAGSVPGTYNTPFVIAGNRRVVWDGGANDSFIAIAATGNLDGSQLVIDYPPNTATGVFVSDNAHVNGDWIISQPSLSVSNWDVTKHNVLVLAVIGTTVIGVSRALDPDDVAAPTIASATVFASSPTQITIVMTGAKPLLLLGAITGLDVVVTVGTDRTITGIVSGDGAGTFILQMSGAFDGTETAVFRVAANRVAINYNGTLLATGDTPVTLSFIPATLALCAAWTRVWESNVAMTPTSSLPANLTAWTSQDGSSTAITFPGGGAPKRTAAPDASMHVITADGSQRLVVALPSSLTNGTDFAFFGRMKGDGDAVGWIGFDTNAAAILDVDVYYDGNHFSVQVNVSGVNTIITDSVSVAGSAYHVAFIARVGTTWSLRTDNNTAATATDSTNLATLTQMFLGNAHITGPSELEAGKFFGSDWGLIIGRDFTTLERANIMAYLAAR